MKLRPQCAKCPWRDPTVAESVIPGIVEHARTNPDGFVCHTRMGPCDGPRHAGLVETQAVPS